MSLIVLIMSSNHSPSPQAASWQRILAESYTKPATLLQALDLPNTFDTRAHQLFHLRVPKPFVAKMRPGDINDPLLLQVLPQADEFLFRDGFTNDPLDEKRYNPLPGLLHKYSSRVLLTLRGACAVNCRYCFRRHFDYDDNRISDEQVNAILDYIQSHPQVNEVILSGGDPLMAKDDTLAKLCNQLAGLTQLKRLRLHTRLPVMIPERLTDELIACLTHKPYASIMVLHINHPNEIDDHLAHYLARCRTAGITLLNQSVLLKGVNDNVDTLVRLSEQLFRVGILPYYLFLLDKVNGTAHFEVEPTKAAKLIRQVASQLPGYLVPKLARETPGLASKDMWQG